MAKQFLLPYDDEVAEVILAPYPDLILNYISYSEGKITLETGGRRITLAEKSVTEPSTREQWLSSDDMAFRYFFRVLKVRKKGILFSVVHLRTISLAQDLARDGVCLRMKESMKHGLNEKQRYEAENILERWFISLVNDHHEDDIDPIFSRHKLAVDYPATQKMRTEMEEKHLPDRDKRIENILYPGFTFLDGFPYQGTPDVVLDETKGELRIPYGIVFAKFPLFPERLNLLLRIHNSIADLASMVVRYACLLSRGQQWSIPTQVYQHLVENYDLQVEGFASPLNSQIIVVAASAAERQKYPPYFNYPPLYFCSIFLDTDFYYGSIGDFFSNSFIGMTVLANPPFVLDILEKTATKALETLSHTKESTSRDIGTAGHTKESTSRDIGTAGHTKEKTTTFFVVTPAWRDASFHQRLSKSNYLKELIVLEKGKHYYLDLKGGNINAPFESSFFILSSGKGNFSGLKKELLSLYK